MNTDALKELLFKMADDLLIIGHRNSEWTGLGPILEEDIAFSSMAQDKIGQSQVLYELLHELGESEPDTVAFARNSNQFHNCTYVELPIGEYDFSLIRHLLFDFANWHRWDQLRSSSFTPLAEAANKFRGEDRYHTMHASNFIKVLGNSTDETVQRMQNALDESIGYALGIFEKSSFEDQLISEGIFVGENVIFNAWRSSIIDVLDQTKIKLPDLDGINPTYGGRTGSHTEHLQPLLTEMSEVLNIDPTAKW